MVTSVRTSALRLVSDGAAFRLRILRLGELQELTAIPTESDG